MINIEEYKTKPIISILNSPSGEQDKMLEESFSLPKNVKKMVVARETGAYIRGLAKNNKLVLKQAQIIALIVLEVALGRLPSAKLASALSMRLKIANDKAQVLAQEIEKDLLTPVKQELEEYLKNNDRAAAPKVGGAKNVLNLKDQKRKVSPPPMPRTSR